ncbi:hypothetical protein IU427_22240 [Nocardia beijingensis]|uniref:hypothetical protein n=1 Tax=Nocardia beijingensis TaxID=95162 RepID=UPI0018963825|nr:hypothetical protein [Nocardia beijingensis]MBF6467887.1 hypothetical protein [Nocardia beijingensis]
MGARIAVARKDLPVFSATTSTAARRISARAIVAGAIAAVPLTISTIPASAAPATSAAVGTEIGHDRWDDRLDFRGKDWPGDHDNGRGNDPLWRLLHGVLPNGVFGSS